MSPNEIQDTVILSFSKSEHGRILNVIFQRFASVDHVKHEHSKVFNGPLRSET